MLTFWHLLAILDIMTKSVAVHVQDSIMASHSLDCVMRTSNVLQGACMRGRSLMSFEVQEVSFFVPSDCMLVAPSLFHI